MKNAGQCDVGRVPNVSSKQSAGNPTPRARHSEPSVDCHFWITSSFYLHDNHAACVACELLLRQRPASGFELAAPWAAYNYRACSRGHAQTRFHGVTNSMCGPYQLQHTKASGTTQHSQSGDKHGGGCTQGISAQLCTRHGDNHKLVEKQTPDLHVRDKYRPSLCSVPHCRDSRVSDLQTFAQKCHLATTDQ